MDLVKIGKYIAEKRKRLGMTQRQVAEKLGMSDKSVSKWERGICLPDVSVYPKLCELLGITLNEFLAGEDISEENIARKSEDNLMRVAEDNKNRQRNLKKVIVLLLAAVILAAGVLGVLLYRGLSRPRNYIEAVARDSMERKTAELLSGVDGVFMFRYFARKEYETMTLYMTEYRGGEKIRKDRVAEFTCGGMAPSPEGLIVLVPDFESFTVKLIATENKGKYSYEIPILEEAENREYYGRLATEIEGKNPIRFGEEQGLLALVYGENGAGSIPIRELESGKILTNDNDYVYYFSIQFTE